jgi:hypothetical protein
MYHYALALRRSSFLMVNSSWTKNHVDAILAYSDPFLYLVHLPLTLIGGLLLSLSRALAPSFRTRSNHVTPKQANIVYPPCDTRALSNLPLERRPSLLLSLAQFRYKFSFIYFPPFIFMRSKTREGPRGADPHDGITTNTVSGAPPVYAPVTRRRSAKRGGFCTRRRAERARGLITGLGM